MKSPTHAMHLKKVSSCQTRVLLKPWSALLTMRPCLFALQHSCLGVCIKELTHILENVTLVDEKDRPILKKLNGTLVKLMDSHGKVSQVNI